MSDSALQNKLQHCQTVTLSNSIEQYQKPSPGLPLLRVENAQCKAIISLQGAQLLEFKPTNGSPLLWLSPNAVFEAGRAIRGGIPVCLPWFGVNQQDPDKPKHGFVRNRHWILEHIKEPDDDQTTLSFLYLSDETDLNLYPYPFSARLTLVLSHQITIQLEINNHTEEEIPVSWALHSYHPIHRLSDTAVAGAEGLHYLDNINNLKPTLQQGHIRFIGEVDRVYESVPAVQQIIGQPAIKIEGKNCDTAIVWNPGAAHAANMSDLGEETHHQFICVERGAAFANSWTLAAEETAIGEVVISEIT